MNMLAYAIDETANVPAAAEEKELSMTLSVIERQAQSITISNDADYKGAAEFGRMLKQKAAEVKDFFKPMKEQANKAHKAICDREKTMLEPLINAETVLKRAMGDYSLEQERKRRELEEERQRKIQEDIDRKLAEAIAAEEAGDKERAADAILDAQLIEEVNQGDEIIVERPKANGAYTTKDWEIVNVNQNAVPVSVNGAVIRPVDVAAIMRLIRASKGEIEIPGVTFKETARMSFRK